jgi:hypothetical protein
VRFSFEAAQNWNGKWESFARQNLPGRSQTLSIAGETGISKSISVVAWHWL